MKIFERIYEKLCIVNVEGVLNLASTERDRLAVLVSQFTFEEIFYYIWKLSVFSRIKNSKKNTDSF